MPRETGSPSVLRPFAATSIMLIGAAAGLLGPFAIGMLESLMEREGMLDHELPRVARIVIANRLWLPVAGAVVILCGIIAFTRRGFSLFAALGTLLAFLLVAAVIYTVAALLAGAYEYQPLT